MYTFKLKGKFETGKETCYVVENNQQCENFFHLIGREVRLNGSIIEIKTVQVSSLPPYKIGELIGLVG